MAGAEPLGANLARIFVYSMRFNWQCEKGGRGSDENHHSPVSRAQRPTPSLPDMLDKVPKADNVLDTVEGHCQIKFQHSTRL
ncbi:hypothetical protein PEX1_055310 [Penicillium expansum]|uniref:Uncharacterized protein n=1 Tax=Penicillium expansum TaxID=27334 RepID=A0A0A2IXE8_PENEN|nr:hypothetical protein PEX2_080520 [Penicillium expansum]KGO42403.1 hypothetical protein PEXP_053550 [Penicillium expansum]KGO44850.1 hypothetical protein PEX1_055310 [Penicillium expansum]KGO56445.1 hypothetical protein PEX2_080520 [Penicillium expansum]